MLRVGPVSRRFRFALSRLGSTAALRKDIRRGGRLRVRIPDDARTGVYLVRVRAGGRRAVWPVIVNGRPAGGAAPCAAPRPLVILPVATWQGGQPVGLGRRRLPGHAVRRHLGPGRPALRGRQGAAPA